MSLEKYILRRGIVGREELEYAKEQASAWYIGLPEALVAYAGADPVAVAKAEARSLKCACLAGEPYAILEQVDSQLLASVGRHAALRLGALPVKTKSRGKTLSFATFRSDNRAARNFFREELGFQSFEEILVTSDDVNTCVQHVFRDEMSSDALNPGLEMSQTAAKTVSGAQQAFLAVLVAGVITVGALWPLDTLRVVIAALAVSYVVVFSFRFLLAGIGSMDDVIVDVGEYELEKLHNVQLPVYTILLPLYYEASSLEQLLAGIKGLDYPHHKLDVIVLLEEDDAETREALRTNPVPNHWSVITVPAGNPKTKPRACNYGMLFARGQYLVVYDAEDVPDSDQLLKVVSAFENASASTICFQCLITYYNRSKTLLSRLFTLEHWYWFDAILPGLSSLDMPIPMGGTSNHFHLAKLRAIGGWDPYNLTEDADLSVRISIEDQRVGVLKSTTREEANPRVWNWIRQRSRWLKGFMQTFFVHTRNPLTAVHDLGVKAWLSLVFFVGGTPFVFLVSPVLLIIAVLGLGLFPAGTDAALTPLVVAVSLSALFLGWFLGVYMHMLTAFKRGVDALVPVALMTPWYWLLHSVAALRALAQLVRRPHFWEKTEHFLLGGKPAKKVSGGGHGGAAAGGEGLDGSGTDL